MVIDDAFTVIYFLVLDNTIVLDLFESCDSSFLLSLLKLWIKIKLTSVRKTPALMQLEKKNTCYVALTISILIREKGRVTIRACEDREGTS